MLCNRNPNGGRHVTRASTAVNFILLLYNKHSTALSPHYSNLHYRYKHYTYIALTLRRALQRRIIERFFVNEADGEGQYLCTEVQIALGSNINVVQRFFGAYGVVRLFCARSAHVRLLLQLRGTAVLRTPECIELLRRLQSAL